MHSVLILKEYLKLFNCNLVANKGEEDVDYKFWSAQSSNYFSLLIEKVLEKNNLLIQWGFSLEYDLQ